MVSRFILLLVCISGASLISCDNCGGRYRIGLLDIGFELRDLDTDQTLLGIGNKYSSVDFALVQLDGDTIMKGMEDRSGRVVFRPFSGEADFILDMPLSREYVMRLIETNTQDIDLDTIRIDYQLSEYGCDDEKFTYINFYYNDSLYIARENWTRSVYAIVYK